MAERAQRVIILGAAGRDFHNFNTFFRGNPAYHVVAFTATQIPDIEGRRYPPELAGPPYDEGIPIVEEERLEELIREEKIDVAVFAYSDTSHLHVMHLASRVLAAGADYWLLGPGHTSLASSKPVISICAVRTGCGKSQTTRFVADRLRAKGKRVVVVRHPMPYGDLNRQAVQRFASREDLDRHECTIEEREEYEPHIDRGITVYAGVDYAAILRQAEEDADVIIWDGGNNDLPFFRPDLHIVVVDPHRPGHELRFHPGEANFRMADVIVINKMDTASPENVRTIKAHAKSVNPTARIVEAESPIRIEQTAEIEGKRVLVIEDGPTVTHGGMTYGAGTVAARRHRAAEIIDPRPYAVRSIQDTFKKYPEIGPLLPAMGYSKEQVRDLEETIRRTPCDVVIIGTPIDLRRLIQIEQPSVRVTYELQQTGGPDLETILNEQLQ
jgi:predicted GTPase